MMDFIIYGLPRSGTAWASAWLTTERTICWHDPLTYCAPEGLDKLESSKMYKGIADTFGWLLEDRPEKKLILVRDPDEINASLVKIGLDPLSDWLIRRFNEVPGKRVIWKDLWNNPEDIWHYLLPKVPFDEERTEQLAKMRIVKADRPDSVPKLTHAMKLVERMKHEQHAQG